jgi:hypothetical protein
MLIADQVDICIYQLRKSWFIYVNPTLNFDSLRRSDNSANELHLLMLCFSSDKKKTQLSVVLFRFSCLKWMFRVSRAFDGTNLDGWLGCIGSRYGCNHTIALTLMSRVSVSIYCSENMEKNSRFFFCMFYLEAVDGKKSKRWMDRKNIIISFSKSINCSEVHSH